MRTVPREPSQFTNTQYSCGTCKIRYQKYNDLVTHLFWKHGTESEKCQKCFISRWTFAVHVCNVLPIEEITFKDENDANNNVGDVREYEFCYCGKNIADAPMIGCDGQRCQLQWYHFGCVGVTEPPDGDWLCPSCSK